MRVVVLDKPAIIDGRQRREGEVVLVADGIKPTLKKLVNNFDESYIRKVLVGKPLEKKPIAIEPKPTEEELDKIK